MLLIGVQMFFGNVVLICFYYESSSMQVSFLCVNMIVRVKFSSSVILIYFYYESSSVHVSFFVNILAGVKFSSSVVLICF